MTQTTYNQNMAMGFPGMRANSAPAEIISRLISTQALYEVNVGTPANTTLYRVSITQNGVTIDYEFTTDASATQEEIVAGLRALIDAGTQLVETETVDTALFSIESTSEDYGITVAVSGGGAGFVATLLVAQGEELPFGVGVVTDPKAAVSGRQCRLPRATGEITDGTFLGIVMADVTREVNPGGYRDKSEVSIMSKGYFIFRTESAIAEGGAIYCRFQDPTAAYGLGSLRGDADTADAVAIPTAAAVTSAGAGELCVGKINLP